MRKDAEQVEVGAASERAEMYEEFLNPSDGEIILCPPLDLTEYEKIQAKYGSAAFQEVCRSLVSLAFQELGLSLDSNHSVELESEFRVQTEPLGLRVIYGGPNNIPTGHPNNGIALSELIVKALANHLIEEYKIPCMW